MKKSNYKHIEESMYRKGLLMFIQTLEEVMFYYSFESYKLPALNSHFLCFDLLQTKYNIEQKSIADGNFIPLSEEFENILDTDLVLQEILSPTNVLLQKRDKFGAVVYLKKYDNKAKINKYTEIADYIQEICSIQNLYLNTVFDLLIENIFVPNCKYNNLSNIYTLTKTLATELVNGGYSPEYINQELKRTFFNNKEIINVNKEMLIKFFNQFTFEQYSYNITFGVNFETANILKTMKNISVMNPDEKIKKKLDLKHKRDKIVKVSVEAVDDFEAAQEAHNYLETIIGLHRISQHHRPVYIKLLALVEKVDNENNTQSAHIRKLSSNIMFRANNESQLQSYFFDDQLLNNVEPPGVFFRAVSLHNNALDSKEPTNQLLDLWTAIETLVGFKAGDEDKINVVCNILTKVLNRSYIYCHIEQLDKDIKAVLEGQYEAILTKIEDDEQNTLKLAQILSLQEYSLLYNELIEKLLEYPLLQYRIEYFAKYIFQNSETIYNELNRHKQKVKQQIMRIYRNRNMIVHDGKHMPYLEIILGNLHYYVDSLFDVLIEYYHLGFDNNKNIFYHIEIEELAYLNELGIDEKGKKVNAKSITKNNFKKLLFNEYEGNRVKNVVKKAIENVKKSRIENKISD